MQEQLISFETAQLAKEKGFNFIDVHSFYHINNGYSKGYNICISEVNKQTDGCLLTPTQSLLQKWLREKHQILTYVVRYNDGIYPPRWSIYVDLENKHRYIDGNENYEEALEIGLQAALKLIK